MERTLASSAPAAQFLDGVVDRFDERDQALLRELTFGTLRWLRRLDHVIAAASDRRLEAIEEPLRTILRVAAYQLLFLDRVPAYAAVDEAVALATQRTHRGGASFVNAVLRRIGRAPSLAEWPVTADDAATRLGIVHSHPDFLVRRWLRRFGARETERLLAANNRPKPLHLLAFRDRDGREILAERLIEEGVAVEPSPLSPLGLIVRDGDALGGEPFAAGATYVQDEASQLAAWVPPPTAGERVLDAAAAPGGKSFALLAWQPDLRLVAADVSWDRLAVLAANLGRLGRRLPLLLADAAELPLAGGFDRVVVDLPCSGTGTLRKHPELKWRLTEDEIGRLSRRAGRMLAGAAAAVAAGGLLVAITCSIEEEENEEVMARFLAGHPAFSPVDLEALLEPPAAAMVAGPGLWRLLPAGDHDGFTVQVVRRTAGDNDPNPCTA